MRKLLAAALSLALISGAFAQQINGGGSGSVTSIATACGVSGGTITTTGTIQSNVSVSLQTGANYAFQDSDCGKLINLNNAANQTPTIAAANSGSLLFTAGGYVNVCNQGAGTQTITPTTSTIGGAATYVLAAGSAASPKCVGIISDGTNYQVVPSSATASSVTPGTHGSYSTSWFYGTWPYQVVSATQAANQLYVYPFYVSSTISPQTFNIWVTTGVVASNYMAGIYSDANGKPANGAASCVPASHAATASNGVVSTLTLSGCTLTQGWYWMGVNVSGAISTFSLGGTAGTAADASGAYLMGADTASKIFGAGTVANQGTKCLFFASAEASGTMPTLSSPLWSTNTAPVCPHVAIGL